MRKIRLFVNDSKIDISNFIKLNGNDFEYLLKIMRQKIGDKIFVFNGIDGEFLAEIVDIEKKSLTIQVKEKTKDLINSSNVTLVFALLKNVRSEFIATKGTELGVGSFLPIVTKHSVVDKINVERFKISIKEACEQCERNDFPKIFPLIKFKELITKINSSNQDIFILCNESKPEIKASKVFSEISLSKNNYKNIFVIIGPEGGFSKEELLEMENLKNLVSIGLGKRILKADTAIISALTLIQEFSS